jgi:3-hydroxyisobutyrate dehydrogenase
MKIGYIGLGSMGSALAGRLLGDHLLSVWDLNPSAGQAIAERGAHAAALPKDVAQHSDIVLLCLP